MNTPSCSLDEKGLEERKIEVLHVLKDKASAVRSTEDGYVFSVPRSSENLDLAATVISLETECCPFFSFSLDAKAGQPVFTFGISASAETFMKIANGEQNPTAAYMSGKLKVKGDMGQAMRLQKLF